MSARQVIDWPVTPQDTEIRRISVSCGGSAKITLLAFYVLKKVVGLFQQPANVNANCAVGVALSSDP